LKNILTKYFSQLPITVHAPYMARDVNVLLTSILDSKNTDALL